MDTIQIFNRFNLSIALNIISDQKPIEADCFVNPMDEDFDTPLQDLGIN